MIDNFSQRLDASLLVPTIEKSVLAYCFSHNFPVVDDARIRKEVYIFFIFSVDIVSKTYNYVDYHKRNFFDSCPTFYVNFQDLISVFMSIKKNNRHVDPTKNTIMLPLFGQLLKVICDNLKIKIHLLFYHNHLAMSLFLVEAFSSQIATWLPLAKLFVSLSLF